MNPLLFFLTGKTGGPLKPEFFVSKLGVLMIFFVNGIQLSIGSTSDLKATFKLNAFIQSYNMLFIPVHSSHILFAKGLKMASSIVFTVSYSALYSINLYAVLTVCV